MTSSWSVARSRRRRSSSAIDGGRMKIRTRSSPIAEWSCWVPCQSMSNRMSRPSRQRVLHGRLGGSVAVAEHRRPFDELAGGDEPVELGVVDEMIIHILGFAGPLGTRGRGHRHGDVAVGLEQHARDRRLAGTRRRGEDDQETAAVPREVIGWGGGVHGRSCFGRAAAVKRRPNRTDYRTAQNSS